MATSGGTSSLKEEPVLRFRDAPNLHSSLSRLERKLGSPYVATTVYALGSPGGVIPLPFRFITDGTEPFRWEGIAWPNAATMKFKKVCEN
jgi:hypothetical protein